MNISGIKQFLARRGTRARRAALASLLLAAFVVAVLAGSALAAGGNLAKNSSFEKDSNGDGVPNNWTPADLTPSDKRVCNKAYAGACSFKMIGDGGTKYMFQYPAISGGIGDEFTLKIWVLTKGLVLGGGNVTLYLEIGQTDGGFEYDSQNLAPGSSGGWVLYTLNHTTIEAYDSSRIWIKFNPTSGKAWFDKVKFVEVP